MIKDINVNNNNSSVKKKDWRTFRCLVALLRNREFTKKLEFDRSQIL